MLRSVLLAAAALALAATGSACSFFSSLIGDDDASTGTTNGDSDASLGPAPVPARDGDPGAPVNSTMPSASNVDATMAGMPPVRTTTEAGTSAVDAAIRPKPTRGPAQATNGVRYPFPQNRENDKNCTYPDGYLNEDVQAAYAKWKNDTITSAGAGGFRRVQRLMSDPGLQVGSTVSEGIGYGMLIAVYMNDQSLFDDLWKYEQLHLGHCPGNTCPAMELMDWYISSDGSQALGTGGATDADEDMAFALAMADRQWGGQGSLSKSYHQFAVEQITAVWVLEVYQGHLIKPGTWGDDSTVNVSYFAPAYYRVFKSVGGSLPMGDSGSWNPNWDATIDMSYATIGNALNSASGNQNNGLVPAWCTSAGSPNGSALSMGNPTNYQYDSCRTPFRIALDWCWNAEPRAQAYLAKTSSFFSAIGARNIVDGYNLDGTPKPQNPGSLSAAFIGPAGVGAMSSPSYKSFVDDAYGALATDMLLAGGTYYEDSWTVMSLLMMSANFLNFTALP